MSGIKQLLKYQIKSFIRTLFYRPLNAIISVLCIGYMGYTIYGIVSTPLHDNPVLIPLVLLLSTFLLLLTCLLYATTFLSKHGALMKESETFHLLTGPFTEKQVLGYSIVNGVLANILMAIVFAFFVLWVGGKGLLVDGSVGIIFLTFFIVSNTILICSNYLYLLQISKDKKGYSKIAFYGFLCIYVISFIYTYLNNSGMEIADTLLLWPTESYFKWLPIVGWGSGFIQSWLEGEYALFGVFLVLNAGGLFTITYLYLNMKGNFKEKLMMDSQAFTLYYEQAKAGKTVGEINADKKPHGKEIVFKQGADAIGSLNWGIMRKRNALIPWYPLALVIFYLYICVSADLGFLPSLAMILIAVYIMSSDRQFYKDIKTPYFYMIPDTMLRKVLNIFKPQVFKMFILVFLPITFLSVYYSVEIQLYVLVMLVFVSIALLLLSSKLIASYLVKDTTQMLTLDLTQMMCSALLLVPTMLVIYLCNRMDVNILGELPILIATIWHLTLGFGIFIWYSKHASKGKLGI